MPVATEERRHLSPDCGIRIFFGRIETLTGVGCASKCGTWHSEDEKKKETDAKAGTGEKTSKEEGGDGGKTRHVKTT